MNSPIAGFLPILVFAVMLLLILRVISLRSSNALLRGMLLVSASLLIGYSSLLFESDAIAAGAFWLSLAMAGAGTLYVLAGMRSNPGGDTMLLFVTGLLLILFSIYADFGIWIAASLDQAKCQPIPGIITCTPHNFNYLLVLTSLWIAPGLLSTVNASYYMRRLQKEKTRLLELRRRAAIKRREQGSPREGTS